MKYTTYIIVLFLSYFSLISAVHAQSQAIDLKNFETERLNELILQGINNYRKSLSLPALENDEILGKAATNHVAYLLKEKKLSHTQSKSNYKDPQKRVFAYGGKHTMIGENVAFTFANVTVNTKKNTKIRLETYEQLAAHFVEVWVESPPHLKNIKQSFELSGVAVSADPKTNVVYAVQVFGTL
ncbi:MAG TPA: CAP domain-containing protein [Cytophagaceae bacterium]|jgi:uncharacterized protein YkwD